MVDFDTQSLINMRFPATYTSFRCAKLRESPLVVTCMLLSAFSVGLASMAWLPMTTCVCYQEPVSAHLKPMQSTCLTLQVVPCTNVHQYRYNNYAGPGIWCKHLYIHPASACKQQVSCAPYAQSAEVHAATAMTYTTTQSHNTFWLRLMLSLWYELASLCLL